MVKKMSYYDRLVEHVQAAMKKYPRTPVVMMTDNFEVVNTGKNARKIASVIRKCRTQGRVPVVFQRPNENRTFVYGTTRAGCDAGVERSDVHAERSRICL